MKYLLIIIILVGTTTACEKKDEAIPLGSLQVVNAATGVPAVKVNYVGPQLAYGNYLESLAFAAGKSYPLEPGQRSLDIVNASDTTQQIYNGSVAIGSGEISTLYICGQAPAFDTLYRLENIRNYNDSVIGIRFVNLSPGSKAVNIRIKDAAADEVTGLGYKGITAFKTYPATSASTSYVFEVRDAASGELLATYTQSIAAAARFRNIAIVLKGLQGTTAGTAAFGAFTVNYY